MRSNRRISSTNNFPQHDSTVAEAAKKRQEENYIQRLQLTQPESNLQIRKRSTVRLVQKRNSGSQVTMPELPSPTPSDLNKKIDQESQDLQKQNEQLQYFNQIASRFMAKGLDDDQHSSEEERKSPKQKKKKKQPEKVHSETKVETDAKQQEKFPNNEATVVIEDVIPENETMIIQMKQVCRIKMRFKLIVPTSTLPKKMPETIVYWNRCETRVSYDSSSVITQSQLQKFYDYGAVKLHDYPDARQKVATNFPFLNNKSMWADQLQEQFVNPLESIIYYQPELKQQINQFKAPKLTEGHIMIENIRETDVFFNSKFESGNLKQAFIVPQPADFDELTDEEAMIGDYLPKEEQEYLRQMLEQRRDKRAQQGNQEPNPGSKDQNDQNLQSQPAPVALALSAQVSVQKNKEDNKPNPDQSPKRNLDANRSEPKLLKTDPSETQLKKQKKISHVDSEYNLYLQDDTHSDGSRTQWFYFNVMNIKAGTTIRLNIVNMTKPDSSFQKGMQPYVYSTKKFMKKGTGWHRAGKNITYKLNSRTQRSQVRVMDAKYVSGQFSSEKQAESYKQLSTLSFEYKFKYDHDIVYFAHGQPYTYSDYANYICKLEADQSVADRMRVDHLCNSLGGNPVYCVTITSKIKTKYTTQQKEQSKWQKFEYSNNQNVDTVKSKKQKKEEVSDDEEENLKALQSKNEHESQFKKEVSKLDEDNQHFDMKPDFDLSSDEEDQKKKKVKQL